MISIRLFQTPSAPRLRDKLLSSRNEGLYTPPSLRGTIEMPGHNGGGNWGGAAVDPSAGLLYVESKDLPTYLKLRSTAAARPGNPRIRAAAGIYSQNCAGCHGTGPRRASRCNPRAHRYHDALNFRSDQVRCSERPRPHARVLATHPTRSRFAAGRTWPVLRPRPVRRTGRSFAALIPLQDPNAAPPQRYWAPYDFLFASDRLVGHRSAVVAIDGLRSEHRRHQVAGPAGRGQRPRGRWARRYRQPLSARRIGRNRRRFDCSQRPHRIENCAPTTATPAK